jgi:hypothetical protein
MRLNDQRFRLQNVAHVPSTKRGINDWSLPDTARMMVRFTIERGPPV